MTTTSTSTAQRIASISTSNNLEENSRSDIMEINQQQQGQQQGQMYNLSSSSSSSSTRASSTIILDQSTTPLDHSTTTAIVINDGLKDDHSIRVTNNTSQIMMNQNDPADDGETDDGEERKAAENCDDRSSSPSTSTKSGLLMVVDNDGDSDDVVLSKATNEKKEKKVTIVPSESSESLLLMCRYCHEGSIVPTDPLIQPCGCRGSLANAHRSCINKWIRSQLEQPEEYNLWDPDRELLQCEICHCPLETSTTTGDAQDQQQYLLQTALTFLCCTLGSWRRAILIWALLLKLSIILMFLLIIIFSSVDPASESVMDTVKSAMCLTFALFWLAFCGGCYHMYRFRDY